MEYAHHLLAGANEVMPYRVYVPKGYSASRPAPLVIALHGLGGTEDSFFDQYQRQPVQLAEKHGFLMAAPLGYRVDGFYGSRIMSSADVAAQRRGEYSEKDVLEVLRLICDGLSNREIAGRLRLSVNTIAVHRANIMNTLGVHKTAELVMYAVKNGLVTPE